MGKVKASDPCCLCCCRPKSQHIARDLQCPETVYFIENDLGASATRLEALQAQPVGEESGWLIEENAGGIIHWIALAENEWPRTEIHVRRARSGRDMMVETDKYRSPVVRVKDANEALRFARREDAEALIKLFDRFLLCPVATEHMWSAAR